jgi:hypothetical protein
MVKVKAKAKHEAAKQKAVLWHLRTVQGSRRNEREEAQQDTPVAKKCQNDRVVYEG